MRGCIGTVNMKWPLFFTVILLFLYYGETIAAPAVEIEHRGSDAIATLDRREEPSETTATTTTDNGPTKAPTATTTDVKEEKTTTATTTDAASSSTTDEVTSVATTVPSLDTSAASNSQSSQNSTKSTYTGGLPIQPELSPALGVGGFILLVSGAALALIGIRKTWLYVSLSTAFLAALGVTVLIEYVMNPPVTNAVQGGYLVAVVVTGAVFGGLALVFNEITEGLCCLLGGFCIGMWLMTVKAGGLVTESGAKVGFIIAFTVGFYCLSFSHYTRSYGSMVCTSFGGATALVLGIDCFSRAGLKEFWLYVWGLNDNIFPLNTDTYPVTRNIRVELAITIIVAIFGVIAQMRLWKVIKERRANEENSRKEEERKKEEADIEVGRQLEEKNLRERAEWEHMYGNGSDGKEPSMTETAVAEDSRRGSDGFNSSNNEKGNSFEMKDFASPSHHGGASDCGNTLDAVEEVIPETQGEEGEQTGQRDGHNRSHHENDNTESRDEPGPDSHSDANLSRPATPPPEKAFHVSTDVRVDDSENGAIVGSEAGTPRSKRFSGRSFKSRLSWRSGNGVKTNHQSESEEALVAHEDATSSVAGIVDDIQTLSSRRPSLASIHNDSADDATLQSESTAKQLPDKNVLQEASENNLNSQPRQIVAPSDGVDSSASHQNHESHLVTSQTHETHKPDEQIVSSDMTTSQCKEIEVQTAKVETPQEKTEIQNGRLEGEQADSPSSGERDPESSLQGGFSEIQSKDAAGAAGNPEHPSGSQESEAEIKTEVKPIPQPIPIKKPVKPKLDMPTVNRIPEQTSKVVHTFRTNEWAKHLSDAETPELEPLEFEHEQPIEPTEADEAAAPVNVEGLLQTPFNAQPPPAITSPAENQTGPEDARQRSRLSMAPDLDIARSKTRNNIQSMFGARSPPMSRNVSSTSLVAPQLDQGDRLGPLRSPSAPFLTITAPSHGKDNDKEQTDSPRWSGPPPLLAVRENMVRNRMSSTSLRYDPWASRSASRQSLADPSRVVSPTFSIPEERDETMMEIDWPVHDEDDVPLSKRRAMLQRQTIESPSTTSLQGIESPRPPPATSAESGRSATAMAAWRQSMREDISQRRDPLSLNSPTPASSERPQSFWGSVQQMKDASNARVGDAIADGMQRGSMTDLHRQAMRRMQASANRKL